MMFTNRELQDIRNKAVAGDYKNYGLILKLVDELKYYIELSEECPFDCDTCAQ